MRISTLFQFAAAVLFELKSKELFMDHRTDILDLRTALVVLRQTPGRWWKQMWR